eukprot:748274-Hanusia_phi.AAC.2
MLPGSSLLLTLHHEQVSIHPSEQSQEVEEESVVSEDLSASMKEEPATMSYSMSFEAAAPGESAEGGAGPFLLSLTGGDFERQNAVLAHLLRFVRVSRSGPAVLGCSCDDAADLNESSRVKVQVSSSSSSSSSSSFVEGSSEQGPGRIGQDTVEKTAPQRADIDHHEASRQQEDEKELIEDEIVEDEFLDESFEKDSGDHPGEQGVEPEGSATGWAEEARSSSKDEYSEADERTASPREDRVQDDQSHQPLQAEVAPPLAAARIDGMATARQQDYKLSDRSLPPTSDQASFQQKPGSSSPMNPVDSDESKQDLSFGDMLTLAARIRNGEPVDETLFSLVYHRFPQETQLKKRSSTQEETQPPPPSSPSLPPRPPPRVLYQRWSVRSVKDGLVFGEPRAPPSISLPSDDKTSGEEARRALEESILKLVLEEVAAGLELEEVAAPTEIARTETSRVAEERSEEQEDIPLLPDEPALRKCSTVKEQTRKEPVMKLDVRRRRMKEGVLAYMGPEHRKLMMNLAPQQDVSELLETLETFKQKLVEEAMAASSDSPVGSRRGSLSELETASYHADAAVMELLEDPKIFQLVKKSVIRRLEGKRR